MGENPFPNCNPITKIPYIELDIIVSKLVVPKILKSHLTSSDCSIIGQESDSLLFSGEIIIMRDGRTLFQLHYSLAMQF